MTVVLLALLVAVFVASLFLGSQLLAPSVVWEQLRIGPDATANQVVDSEAHHIVWQLRLSRTLLALAAGAALAVAGALAQAWTRNPLADPGFIGVTAGAAFAVALSFTAGLAATVSGRMLAALVGAAIASMLVLWVSRVSVDPLTLILVGVGVSAALQACTIMLALYDTSIFDGMRHWTVGTAANRGFPEVTVATIGLLIGLVVAAIAARPLDLLAMGEDTSKMLGSSPALARGSAAIAIIVLAAATMASVGPVAFIGFAAPHIVRPVVGPSLQKMLVPTALVGAVLTLAADIVGRLVIRPGELEMSVVIALVGAPLLIWVVRRAQRSSKGLTL